MEYNLQEFNPYVHKITVHEKIILTKKGTDNCIVCLSVIEKTSAHTWSVMASSLPKYRGVTSIPSYSVAGFILEHKEAGYDTIIVVD